MLEYLRSVSYPPSVGRFNNEQIAQRSTWQGIPDDEVGVASMQRITMRPNNASTTTLINPLDPGSGEWLDQPEVDWGRVFPAGRM